MNSYIDNPGDSYTTTAKAKRRKPVRSSAWFGVGRPKYKILFARNSVFECFSPPCGRIKAEILAWLYRMKGEGRDAIVVDAKPSNEPSSATADMNAPIVNPDANGGSLERAC